MTQQELAGEPEPYEAEARRVMANYGWQLTSPDQLAQRARALREAGMAQTTAAAVVGAYCALMHQAFLGDRGAEQQRRACEELGRSLAALLSKHHSQLPTDERDDAIQDTLVRVWRARASCREPIAFLAFAAGHLLSATQLAGRQRRRLGEPLPAAPGDDESEPIEIPDPTESPAEQVIAIEQRARLRQFIAELRRLRPRAHGQILVLAMRLLDDLSYDEIAARLAITPATAHTRFSRIIATIRGDADLLQRARELGLI